MTTGAKWRRPVWLGDSRWLTVAKIAITVGLLAALLRSVNLNALFERLKAMQPEYAVMAVLAGMVQTLLGAARLKVIAGAIRRAEEPIGPWRKFLAATWSGNFAGQVAPTIAGDALRVFLLRDGGLRTVFKSVLVDRGFGVASLLGLVFVACLLAPPVLVDNPHFRAIAWLLAGAFAALALLLVLAPRLQFLTTRLRGIGAAVEAIGDMRRILLSPGLSGKVVLLCLAIHGLSMVMFGLLARGQAVSLGPSEIFAIVSLMSFAAMIPATFAGWGVREGIVMVLFATTGTPPEAALLLSLSFGAVVLAAALPGALLLLMPGRSNPATSKLDTAPPA